MRDNRTCATCCFWLADHPEAAYRADCAVGELTRPEAWQTCPRWAPRVLSGPAPTVAQQSQARGLWGDYWNIPALVSETLLGYLDMPDGNSAAVVRREETSGRVSYAVYRTTAYGRYEETSAELPRIDRGIGL